MSDTADNSVETAAADAAPAETGEGVVTPIKKKDVYDHVTVATGLRKREVREAVDATLAYLHSVLDEGRDLQLPPLGKIKVVTRGEGEKTRTQYRLNLQKTKSAEGAEPGPEGHQDSLALD